MDVKKLEQNAIDEIEKKGVVESMSEPQKQCFPHNYVQMQGNDRVEQLIFCKDCGHVINAVVAGTTAVVVKDAKGISRRLVAGEFVVDS